MPRISIQQLAKFAQDVEITDPIDWGMLNIQEEQAFQLMASHVMEQFGSNDMELKQIAMLATMTKLLVENFVLNLKLKGL